MTAPRYQLDRLGRTCGRWVVALAVAMYLLLPAIQAEHSALAHAAAEHLDHAHHVHADHGHDHDDSSHETPERDVADCELCHLIGTLAHGGVVPGPAVSVLPDLGTPEVVLSAEAFGLRDAVRVAPAAPRAPPLV